jgi:5-(carboxyamino)imidazole ribonucleotide mutase
LAAQILGTHDPDLQARIEDFREQQTRSVLDNPDPASDS